MKAAVNVISIDRARRAADARSDNLAMELDSRRLEERRMAAEVRPLLARLYLITHDVGPMAHSTVAQLDHHLTRHARRWQTTGPEAA